MSRRAIAYALDRCGEELRRLQPPYHQWAVLVALDGLFISRIEVLARGELVRRIEEKIPKAETPRKAIELRDLLGRIKCHPFATPEIIFHDDGTDLYFATPTEGAAA